jgi:hypothetical protein
MSDHGTALVLLEAWPYNSPDVVDQGHSVDIGLLAEALVYYDKVYFTVGNQPQFAELLNWFLSRNLFYEFLSLLRDGSLCIYEYSFFISPYVNDNHHVLYAMQDEKMKIPNSFIERYLEHDIVRKCFPRRSLKEQFQNAIAENIIEAKVDEFGTFIIESQNDCVNPRRHEIIVQAFIDELYKLKSLGKPPKVEITVTPATDGFHQINWNIDFNQTLAKVGKKLAFHSHYPLVAAGIANRTLLSAANLGCDLYLSRPMSVIAGDKLFEASRATVKSKDVIEQLQSEVEFPDLRKLVNQGQISFKEVLKVRKKARKFREWLQSEVDRDRSALIAYHQEVAKESGFTKGVRKSLNIFGAIGVPAATLAVKEALTKSPLFSDPITDGIIATMVGGGTKYLLDLASKMGAEWKPVIFGNWYRDRIRHENRKLIYWVK